MIVEVSAEAERDLLLIVQYIARDDPAAAMHTAATLRDACATLADFPQRFPVVARYERQGIRHRTIGNYLIFYRIFDNKAVILHILHGARDYGDLLGISLPD